MCIKKLLTFFDILLEKRQNIKEGGVVLKNLVVIVLAMFLIFGFAELKSQQLASNRYEITLATPFRKNIVETVTLYGTVQEEGRERLYAKGNAYIEEVYVTVGEIVKAGDPLLKLQPITSDMDFVEPYEDAAAWTNKLYQTALIDENLAKTEVQSVLNRLLVSETLQDLENKCEEYILYSPIDGMIISIAEKTGSLVTAYFPTVTVTDLDKLSIRSEATESILRQLKLGSRCNISVPALGDKMYMGELSHIAPYAHETGVLTGGGTYVTEVIATVNNHGNTLRPGYQANVKVDIGQQKNALLVPIDVIAQDETGTEYVMVWTGSQAYRQEIITGKEVEDYVQVVVGLSEKQRVIRNVNQFSFTEDTVLYEAS